MSFWKFLRENGIYIIVGLIWFLLRRQDMPYTFEHSADVYLWFVGSCILMTKYLAEMGRYKSPSFVGNGIKGSCTVPPVNVYPWQLYRLGGIKFPPLPFFQGDEATVIVHPLTVTMLRDNYISTARFRPIERLDVPPNILAYIDHHKYPTDKIYIGFASEALETYDPDFVELEEQLIDKNSQINIKHDAMKGKLETVEGILNSAGRMTKNAGKPRRLGGLLPPKQNNGDDEDNR